MADQEWWSTAQRLGLSWLSPKENDEEPSDEILRMLSDICTKENLSPPSYLQFPLSNGSFSSHCQVGEFTEESHGESADIALRNAAVNMLIFLKQQKATAMTRHLKENDEINCPIPHRQIGNVHQEIKMELDKKDENQMTSKRCSKNEQEHKNLPYSPIIGINTLNKTKLSNANPKNSTDMQEALQNLPKFNDENYQPVDPRNPAHDGITNNKENLKQYPPEIIEMYQSYKSQCQSRGDEWLSIEEIWNQCIADSKENQAKTQNTNKPWRQLLNADEMKQSKICRQSQKNGKKLSGSTNQKIQESHKFKDATKYRTEMVKNSAHIPQGPFHTSRGPPHIPQGPAHIPRGPSLIPRGPSHIPRGPSHIPQESSHNPRGPSHIPQESSHNPRGPSHIPRGPPHIPQGQINEDIILDMDDINSRYLTLPKIWKQCQYKAQEEEDELDHKLIQKLENMKIETLTAIKTKSLSGFFLIMKCSRNPGMVKLRNCNIAGDHVAQVESICEEEKLSFSFEEEEVEVDKGVEDEWESVLKIGQDLVFSGNGSSPKEAKEMACRGALLYIKIMTK